MPWIDTDFAATANPQGEIQLSLTRAAPVSGKVRQYRLQTANGPGGRTHHVTLTITRLSDTADSLELEIDILDGTLYEADIDPPYRVRSGESYQIELNAIGFDAHEEVEGVAGVYYTFFFNLS